MNTKSKTKTPRTDVVAWIETSAANALVTADFARQLETELTAANARAAELEGALRDVSNEFNEKADELWRVAADARVTVKVVSAETAALTYRECSESIDAILAKHQPLAPSLPGPTGTMEGETK